MTTDFEPPSRARARSAAAKRPKTAVPEENGTGKGGGTNLKSDAAASSSGGAARHLAAKMIEQTADPEMVAATMSAEFLRAAEALLESAAMKGPMAVAAISQIGRILGASWVGTQTAAGGKAARHADLVDRLGSRLNKALAGQTAPLGHVSVTPAPQAERKLPF
jgi:hypothetical protein